MSDPATPHTPNPHAAPDVSTSGARHSQGFPQASRRRSALLTLGRLAPDEMFPGPPGNDPRFRVQYVSLPSGLTLRVVECGPTDAARVILCLHGWGSSAYSYRTVLPALADHDVRAIAIDLPGHGLSAKPNPKTTLGVATYCLAGLTAAVTAVCDALGLTRFVVAGHSMSGPIAAQLALDLPERVTGLALLAPVGFSEIGHQRWGRALTPEWSAGVLPYIAPRFIAALAVKSAYSPVEPTERDIDEYWAPTQFPNCVRAFSALLHTYEWDAGTQLRLDQVTVPAIVLAAELDVLVAVPEARTYAERIPRSVFHVMAGAGHALPDLLPHDVADHLLSLC